MVGKIQTNGDFGNMIRVEDNMGLVAEVVNKHFNGARNRMYKDLMQEGYLALCLATKSYVAECGFEFSTYAYNHIYWKLIEYVNGEMEFCGNTISGEINYAGQVDDAVNFITDKDENRYAECGNAEFLNIVKGELIARSNRNKKLSTTLARISKQIS